MIAFAPGTAALAVALAATPTDAKPLPPGNWGGDHAAMAVSEKNVRFEFDCAHGFTDGPISPDADGNFEAPGTLVREFGPTRQDGEKGQRVRYVGRVEGGSMTVRVLAGAGAPVGTFTLERDRPARLRKCQ